MTLPDDSDVSDRKHLMGDILPYTCIVEDCSQSDIFYMTKEAWLNHIDKEYGGTEQWVCHACSQKNIHATFHKSNHFTAHLQHQHSNGITPQHIPMLCSAWRRKVPIEISACPLCSFEDDDRDVLLDHTAEHIHSFSLRSLPWAPKDGCGEDDDGEEYGVYFKQHPYFDVDSCQSKYSSGSFELSSPDTGSESIASSDHSNSANLMHEQKRQQQQQQLTDDNLDQVPHDISGQAGTSEWLEMLDNYAENPNVSPVTYQSEEQPDFYSLLRSYRYEREPWSHC